MTAPAITTLDDEALCLTLASLGEPAWRARQLRQAMWQPFVGGFGDIRQLREPLRRRLTGALTFSTVEVAGESEADSGDTLKMLCRLADGLTVEAVAMETPARRGSRRRSTVCVSSQVGCAVGCPFCATGHMGLRRSCTAAEIVDQVRVAASALHRRGRGPVTHVVYMGMGEPLANVEATVQSAHVLTERAGLSSRRITVSTSGVVPAIDHMVEQGPPVTLAISLHAATDALRDRLVPLNRAHPIADVVAAGDRYARRTGRRITFEWCLIGGVNDSIEQARALRGIAKQTGAHINVIPMNRIADSEWGPPDPAGAQTFLRELRGVRVTVRDTRGHDADAACGQLRALLEPRRDLRPDGTLGPQRRAARA